MWRAYARKILLFFNIITYFFIFVKSHPCYWKCFPSVLINTRAFKKIFSHYIIKYYLKKVKFFVKNLQLLFKKGAHMGLRWWCDRITFTLLWGIWPTFVLIWRAYGVRIDEYARISDKKLQNSYNLVTKSYKIMTKSWKSYKKIAKNAKKL